MTTVFVDIDTQIDFMYPAGALYVPGAERILPLIAALNRKATTVISTMCAHSEDDPEFDLYGHHCVTGTAGQQKPSITLLNDRARQILFPKPQLDVFAVPALRPLLERLNAGRYVVYGVVTEICVKCAAQGLLQTGKRVEIVTDAIRCLNEAKSQEFLNEFVHRGGHLTSASEVSP